MTKRRKTEFEKIFFGNRTYDDGMSTGRRAETPNGLCRFVGSRRAIGNNI